LDVLDLASDMPVVLDLTTGVNVFVLDWDFFVVAVAELLDLASHWTSVTFYLYQNY
jgi:hypothetical protein